jgi:hypothetical protein
MSRVGTTRTREIYPPNINHSGFAFAVQRECFIIASIFRMPETAPRALFGFALSAKPRFRDDFCPGCKND